jgi:hypothetical protein
MIVNFSTVYFSFQLGHIGKNEFIWLETMLLLSLPKIEFFFLLKVSVRLILKRS